MIQFLQRISKYIETHKLLSSGERCLVALSGGADSVALLSILLKLGYNAEAVHCNFHLRGEESDRDERFVVDLCDSLGVLLHRVHFDTAEYARLHKISIEMAARDLRYGYFIQLARDIDVRTICVAHHRNDSVETMLLNLIRGTGLQGLCGIRPKNGSIVRPLLCASREEIENYLISESLEYVTDSTNLEDDFMRNKIRLNVIPLLKEINPSVVENMQQTANYISDAVRVVDESLDSSASAVCGSKNGMLYIDIPLLQQQPSPETLLFHMLKKYGFSSSQIEQIHCNINAPTGRIYSSDTHTLVFDRGYLVVAEKITDFEPYKIPETGTYVLDNIRIAIKLQTIDKSFSISRESFVATIDAGKVKFPLYLRRVEVGDRFVPFGMKGSKLVSDYLTDCKKNIIEKSRQLVVTDADGHIVWLVGERTDNRFRISSDSSQALILSCGL